jgi:hypothetical protein
MAYARNLAHRCSSQSGQTSGTPQRSVVDLGEDCAEVVGAAGWRGEGVVAGPARVPYRLSV